jgi:phage-related holin
METILNLLSKFYDNITLYTLSLLAILAPIKATLLVVGFLIIVDLITGILKAKKEKKDISSARLRDSISKMLIYHTAVISGYVVQTWMLPEIAIVKIVSGLIGAVELKSIYENLNVLHGSDIFKVLLDKLGSINKKS